MHDHLMPAVAVELRVDSQRHRIVAALTEREVNLPQMVNDAVDAALRDHALAEAVARQVNEQVHAVIREEVKNAVRRAFWSEEVRADIVDALARALAKRAETDASD